MSTTVVNSEDFSVNQWQTNTTAQIVSASISFLASLLVVASISKSFFSVQRKGKHDRTNKPAANDLNNQDTPKLKKKKDQKKATSPYRRIIFLISASDILQSLAYITGPFMAQKTNPQALWAVSDSNAACVLNGTFFYTGAIASLLYFASLCYFYYCKISKRMTDEQFTNRYEKKIHTMIAVICIANACLSFAANTLNTYPTGTVCTNANTPAGCNQQPEIYGECDPKITVYVSYFAWSSLVVSTYSIVVILYSMIRLIYSVSNKDRIYGNLSANPTQQQLQKYSLRKNLLRETMFQAILYSVSWFICQSATIALAFLLFVTEIPIEKFSTVFQMYYSAFIPLNSAFNVFIFTRPAVRYVRRVDPSISRFRAFWMVLKAGCEAPNIEQSPSSINQQLPQQPHPVMSSREPFQCYYYYGNDLCVGLDSLNELRFSMNQQQDKSNQNPFGHKFYDANALCLKLDSLNDMSSVDLRDKKVAISSLPGQDPSNSEELVEHVAVSNKSSSPNANITSNNLNVSEFESGLSYSRNLSSTNYVDESGISVSNEESFKDEE